MVVVLAGDEIDLPQHPPRQAPNDTVAPRRPLGQARIDEQYRDTPALRLIDQVRPELGFHQNQQAWPYLVEERPHREREIVRCIAMVDRVAEAAGDLFGTCRRHGGDQEWYAAILCGLSVFPGRRRFGSRGGNIRKLGHRLCYERRHSDGFASRDRVKPDASGWNPRRQPAHPFTDPLSVFRFAARTQLKTYQHGGQTQPEQDLVNQPEQHVAEKPDHGRQAQVRTQQVSCIRRSTLTLYGNRVTPTRAEKP